MPGRDLDGRIVLVTGASGGIGSEVATACAAAGADVVLSGRRLSELAVVAERIEQLGRRAIVVPLDLREVPAIRRGVRDAEERLGRIDVLVNCAGHNVYRLALEVEEEEWDGILDTNLKGLFFVSQAVARGMVSRGQRGKIVNIASVMGLRGGDRRAAYCASKGGVVQLTKAMAIELGPHGINVNAVAPTFTATPISSGMLDDPERRAQILGMIPLGRLGEPADVASAVVFLASDAADFVTGHVLAVDGGRLAI